MDFIKGVVFVIYAVFGLYLINISFEIIPLSLFFIRLNLIIISLAGILLIVSGVKYFFFDKKTVRQVPRAVAPIAKVFKQ